MSRAYLLQKRSGVPQITGSRRGPICPTAGVLAVRERTGCAVLCWIVRHDHRTMERVFWRVPVQRGWDIHRHRSDRRSLPMVRVRSTVEVNGIGLAYSVAGDTGLPPVVLLHALGEDSNAWGTVVEAVTLRYRT